MEYKARAGTKISDADARKIGARLEQLHDSHGITPQAVVDDARPDGAPLHDYFEWNDSHAAEAYRREQARLMLRSIEIVVPGIAEPVRAFHHVRLMTENEEAVRSVYVSLETVRGDKELLDQIRQEALRELRSWTRRYAQYKELQPLTEPVQAAIEGLQLHADTVTLSAPTTV